MEILEDNPFTQMKGHQEKVKQVLCQQHFAPSSQDSGVLSGCMIPGAKDLLLVSTLMSTVILEGAVEWTAM